FLITCANGFAFTAPAADFSIAPTEIRLRPGEPGTFKASANNMPFKCTWVLDPKPDDIKLTVQPAALTEPTDSITITAAKAIDGVAFAGPVAITCTASEMTKKAQLVLINDETGQPEAADITTAIVGFEQAGASSADSNQQFFFDFFLSRPLP